MGGMASVARAGDIGAGPMGAGRRFYDYQEYR